MVKKTKEINVYTISYTFNNKDRAVNMIAQNEEDARKKFNDEHILLKYNERKGFYGEKYEDIERFKERFELMSVNINSFYNNKLKGLSL